MFKRVMHEKDSELSLSQRKGHKRDVKPQSDRCADIELYRVLKIKV